MAAWRYEISLLVLNFVSPRDHVISQLLAIAHFRVRYDR